jgi:dTDP-4-amino-4,6-dideoxygalactose transaminase
MKKFRNWGTEKRYVHDDFGLNYRMDEIQALVLNKKIQCLNSWNERRREIATKYHCGIKGFRFVNSFLGTPSFHQFVIAHPDRDRLQDYLLENGIETLVHYPIPNHLHASLRGKVKMSGNLKNTEALALEILSLPIYPGLLDSEIDYIIEKVNSFEV